MSSSEFDREIIVIGAGVSGIYQIKRLIDLGIDAIVLEGEDDLGGTWYRNRYPGARFDSESYTYGYSWSQELLDEWHWKERFSGQPENLRYLNFVADKFDLRPHMRFGKHIDSMVWDDDARRWTINVNTVDGGAETYTARFVITSLGPLSIPTLPSYEGMDEFQGDSWHTFYWPKEPVDLTGKRVGVIGTGATGIRSSPRSPTRSGTSPCSSAGPIGVHRSTMPPSTTTRWPPSEPATPRSSPIVPRHPVGSSMCPTGGGSTT